MLKAIFISLIFCASVQLFAQPAGVATELHKGKKCFVHIVEKGNTLYGIKTLYNVEVEDILGANEGLTNDLKIGQKIYVPMPNQSSAGTQTHEVQAGETLYGISKKYDCSVADIKKLNPGVADGISIGQKLKVPGESSEFIADDPVIEKPIEYNVSLKDSVVDHHVLAHETLYSISKRYMVPQDTIIKVNGLRNSRVKKGDVLKIPLKRVNYTVIEKDINAIQQDSTAEQLNASEYKEEYNVALFLPFLFSKNDAEMSKTLSLGMEREMYPTTKIAYDFYQGFRFAADSLAKSGLKVKIHVFDTKKDTATIAKIFAQEEFNSMDLVVGPLYENTVTYTAKLCKKRKIKIVLPFKSPAKVLHQNPYAYNSVPSNMTLLDGAVDYLVEEKSHCNIIILKPYSEKDKAMYDRAVSRFNSKIGSKPGAYNSSIVEMSIGSSGGREISNQIRKDTVNIFLVPSNNIKYVSDVLNRLNKVVNLNPYAKKLKCIAFGFEDWNKFDDLDILHRNKLYQHYTSYRYVDYNNGEGKEFVKKYRSKYDLDPNVYSTQGFDVGMYFMSAMYLYGAGFESKVAQHQIDLVQNDFIFEPLDAGSGRENKRVCVVMYNNYQLFQLK